MASEDKCVTDLTNFSISIMGEYIRTRKFCEPVNRTKVDTRSRDQSSGPLDCEADPLLHDHSSLPVDKGSPPILKIPVSNDVTWGLHFDTPPYQPA